MSKIVNIILLLTVYLAVMVNALEKRDPTQLSSEIAGLQQQQQTASNVNTNQPAATSNNQVAQTPSPTSQNSAAPNTAVPTSSAMLFGSGSNSASSPLSTGSATSTGIDNGYPDNGEAFSNLPTSASFGNSIYAGAATFVKPTHTGSVSPIYPIQSTVNVTFQWQYTAIRVRPVNLTINAVGPNSVTYNIATLNGSATEAVWILGTAPTDTPLMNGYYRIQLYDQRGVKAGYSPGWMVPCTSLSIALYAPDLYNPDTTFAGYCPMCFYSAARPFREALGPIAIAFSVAVFTSVVFMFNVLR